MPSSRSDTQLPDDRQFKRRLLGISIALFLTYLTVAIPLPVLNLYVTNQLGLSAAWGGLSVGISFLATIVTRTHAGKYADQHGGKHTLGWGLLVYLVASLICAGSALNGTGSWPGFAILLTGRALLGIGESFTMVGIITWGLSMAGAKRSGRVIGWVGMGMYGAFAAGSPLGVMLEHYVGFMGVMLASAVMPVIGFILTRFHPADLPTHHTERPSVFSVLPIIWKFGLVVCLQGIGFAAISAFITGEFVTHQWDHTSLGLSAFGIGFVISRILFSHLPDRIGGFAVAYCSLTIEAIGQYLLWGSPVQWLALTGALLSGLGCSMVMPSMGVEVVKRVPPHLKGTSMGGFTAFQDLAYGLTGPLIGIFTGSLGYSFAFLIGGLAATSGILVVRLARQ